ncbi:MAG: SDR family NAD(P)-dependent oxidoreductase [Alphaproteobacteria bacterium]|nr:SDR family NAD(P)-dependent oxidoreductase [Alphaproteobacteria bacterium]
MLEGKVAIVSGAAQGLGEAFARKLAQEGADVLAFDVKDTVADVAKKIAAETGRKVVGMKADVSKRSDVEKVVAKAVEMGGVDILVNNAGTHRKTPVDSSWEQAVADWDFIMDTNFKGVLMLSRACVPHMKEKGGDIVNISTYYVLPARSDGTNQPDTDLYNASKWALNGFTDSWSKSLEEFGIRVNALCMGATDTPMLRGIFPNGEYPADFAKLVMKPEQIAQQMIDLFKDGRTGENIGAWVGYPVEVGPRKAPNKRISGVA